MARHSKRSSHAALSPTPQRSPRSGRHAKRVVALPIAIAAMTSMFFGAQAAHAIDIPKVDKLPKAKPPHDGFASASSRNSSAPLRADKYTVSEGDTVSGISQAHGVSTAELLAANGLSWKTMIFAGQQLVIPSTTNGTESAHVGESIRRHNVASGETLEAIARSYGVQPRAIMTANGLDRSSRLVVGQRLVIPDAVVMSDMPAVAIAS